MSSNPAALPEATLRATLAGLVLGVVFGAANAYIGLKVGMTISASIPAAVMTVMVLGRFRKVSILEANLSQTIGSASTALATGTIFSIPALFMWGMVPSYWQVALLALLGGVLGICAMIPLRRLLIVEAHDELPYPEGTACAAVLRASTESSPGGKWIVYGMIAGAAIKLLTSALFLFPSEVSQAVPFLPKAELALEVTPALLAVGYILAYRQAAICVAGSIVSALALTPLIAWIGASLGKPLYPEMTKLVAEMNAGEIWSRYVRYVGAGAVASAGFMTLARNLPSMARSFSAVAGGFTRRADTSGVAQREQDRDLPGWVVVGGIAAVVLVAALVPEVFGGGLTAFQRATCAAGVGLFGLLFVAVAARIVGIVGVSSQPTSGIMIVTLLCVASLFVAAGWTEGIVKVGVLTVGTVVAIAASKAGDIAQDLKTGFLVGATPWKQQRGQLLSAAVACWAVAGTVMLLGSAFGFGTADGLKAPQATLMKTIIDGVLGGQLPWGLVLTGVGVTLSAVLCGVSGLAFAIGVYLPLASMMPIYVGGIARAIADRGKQGDEAESDPGVLAASGVVAGEGLAGIAIAAGVALGALPKSREPLCSGGWGMSLALLAVGLTCAFFIGARRSR